MLPAPNNHPESLTPTQSENLKSESKARKALKKNAQRQEDSAREAELAEAEKKSKRSKKAKNTRVKKVEKKAHLKTKKEERKRRANITQEEIDKHKRPSVGYVSSTEHTLMSINLELKMNGVLNAQTKTCFLDPEGKLKITNEHRKQDTNSWKILVWKIGIYERIIYIPPPSEYYADDDFPINSDAEWHDLVEKHITKKAEHIAWNPSSKLANFLGLDINDIESYDEASMYYNSQALTKHSARRALHQSLMELGLLDDENHYSDIDYPEYYHLPYPLTQDDYKHIAMTGNYPRYKPSYLETPSSIIKDDPRYNWLIQDPDLLVGLERIVKESDSSEFKRPVIEQIIASMQQAEFLSNQRQELQRMAIYAFNAGIEYGTNCVTAMHLKEDQNEQSMSAERSEEGDTKTDHTHIYKKCIKSFEDQSEDQITTFAKVIKYIKESNLSHCKIAMENGIKDASLKGVIYRTRTKK